MIRARESGGAFYDVNSGMLYGIKMIGNSYQLQPLKNGNYRLCRPATEIVVKDHYWVWKDHDTAAGARKSSGNAIDFLVEVEGMTFSQAMEQLRSHHEHTRST